MYMYKHIYIYIYIYIYIGTQPKCTKWKQLSHDAALRFSG